MSVDKHRKANIPFGFSQQQIQRLQRLLDTDGKKPSELADEWGISVSAANKDVARMRIKADANSMAELLTKAQRAGAITMTYDPARGDAPLAVVQKDDVDPVPSAENVYSGVLDNSSRPPYNVPYIMLTRLSRMNLVDRRHTMIVSSSLKDRQVVQQGKASALIREFRRIDDPHVVTECAEMRERNNLAAHAIGLPAVGSRMLNKYGIEWVVEGHIHVPTPNTVHQWRQSLVYQPDDLYPSVVPQNLSPRLTAFISAVDRCTAKTFILLDTTPELRPTAVPGANSLDTVSNPGANFIFLDAARMHETVLAHEIGHAWVQYVEDCEDERVMEDVSDPQRLYQLNFVQSFVLDLKVNDVIRHKGFDMSPIEADQAESVASLCRAIEAGYRPPNGREEVFMGLLLATQLLYEDRLHSRSVSGSMEALVKVRHLSGNLIKLSKSFADAVRTHGYEDRDSILNSVNECLLLAFEHTGDGIDLKNELVVPEATEPNLDKYSDWIEGAPVALKVEVGRVMAREEIPAGIRWKLTPAGSQTLLEFEYPEGGRKGSWLLEHPYPFHKPTDIHRMIAFRRQRGENFMNQKRECSPSHPAGPSFPPSRSHRFYMSGLGRFLTQSRLEQSGASQSSYVYAFDNPVTAVDPTTLGDALIRYPQVRPVIPDDRSGTGPCEMLGDDKKKKPKCPKDKQACGPMCDYYPPGSNAGRRIQFQKYCYACCGVFYKGKKRELEICMLACGQTLGYTPPCECK